MYLIGENVCQLQISTDGLLDRRCNCDNIQGGLRKTASNCFDITLGTRFLKENYLQMKQSFNSSYTNLQAYTEY